jgi:hypothetical protein
MRKTLAQRRTIDGNITVSHQGQSASTDPLASQRAELIGQLAVAQFDLENTLTELSRNGASTSQLDAQLQNLGMMMRQVGAANQTTLASLRGDIAAIVAQSSSVAQQARTGAPVPCRPIRQLWRAPAAIKSMPLCKE